jgi:peptidoglycan hydrolase CwlO-like protein
MLLCCLYALPVTMANNLSKLSFQVSNEALNCQIAALPPTSRWMGDRIGKKHLQDLSAVHKSYSTEINRLNKSVQENKATVDKLVLKITSLRNKNKEEIDALKLAHKESIRVLQQSHAKQVNKSSQHLKAAQGLVAGMEILHKELVDEWSHARRDAKGSTKKASELQSRVDKAMYTIKSNKERVDALTD